MESIKINPPKGYEIDKEKSTFEEIVFKKIDTKPGSWEDFSKNCPIKLEECYINSLSEISNVQSLSNLTRGDAHKNLLPTKEYAEAMLALCQLISLRQAWIGDWKPDYTDYRITKYAFEFKSENIGIVKFNYVRKPLSFPTEEMANEFVACFKDLIEKAKILL